MTALAAPPALAWRFFDVTVAAVTRRSPSFVGLKLTGPDLDAFADNGWDQRFKLVLPDAHGSYNALPRHPDWYATWRRLPTDRQNPIRTYTVRAVRPGQREVDVDLVLHGDGGPASRFASRARGGERLVVLGPDRDYDGPHGGLEFRPPARHVGPTLLVGDATAAPAVLSILEDSPANAFGEVVLEVPDPSDLADVAAPPGFRLTWLVRRGPVSGLPAAMEEAVLRLGARPVATSAGGGGLLEPEPDELVWDVPESSEVDGLYAWVAGESSVVTGLRRHLVRDLGVDRRAVAFMGYWRAGRPGG
jgi:NADPH-dependent ferric siderophore reductase